MTQWSKEDLEEMCGDDIVEQLAFLSGCFKYKLSNDVVIPDGWIIPDELLRKFAELIVRECAQRCDEVIKEVEIAIEQCEVVKTSDRLMMLHDGTRNGAHMAKHRFTKHFGVEE